MKTTLTTLIILLIALSSIAQQGINYKALIKDSAGNTIADQSVTVQFTILQGATSVYTETHTPVTDANGVIIINIGKGTAQSGDFETIGWADDDHFLNVQIDTGNGLVDMGTTQFMAVPYALNAETATTASNVMGLEAIDEGNGIGWRLKDRDPNSYGNIGSNAVDLSYNVVASTEYGATGEAAVAIGHQNIASGVNSTAMGNSTIASEKYSTTMGIFTEASGVSSTAMGNSTKALNSHAIAMGNTTTASGASSTAMGFFTEASGGISIAMGNNTKASGDNSTAMGSNTVASEIYATAMGNKTTSSGRASTAMGEETTASGKSATAMGFQSRATGLNSFAVGYISLAGSPYSVAMGNQSHASGASSTALGNRTDATGINATSMGNETKAQGFASTSFGHFSIASSDFTFVSGIHTRAHAYATTAIGRYNSGNGNGASWVGSDPVFEIGNGTTNANRSNAFTVFKNGNATLGGSLTQNSDKRLKENIMPLQYGLSEVLELNPKMYSWKRYPKEKQQHLGLIAQEVQEVIAEVVQTADDKINTLSINYTALITVLINAIQEQQQIIEGQNKKITAQINQNSIQSNKINTQTNAMELLIKRIERLESSNQ